MVTNINPGTSTDRLLTVVLPNFNHGRYLTRAMAAILGQSRPPDELIVIDDASTDNSRDVILSHQARYPALIALFNERNVGALRTLQRGLEAARSRYIYFAAADDEILPGFFENALAALETAPSLGLFCGETVLVDGDSNRCIGFRPIVRPSRKPGPILPSHVAALLARADNFIHTGSTVFKTRSALAKGGFAIETGSFSDGLLARQIALTEGMWFAPTLVSRWFVHSSGFSRSTALDQERAVEALTSVPRWIGANPDFPPWYPCFFQRRWRFASARLALETVPLDRKLIAAMIPDTRVNQWILKLLDPLLDHRLGRAALLAWLTFYLKPFQLRAVVLTAIDRRIERLRSHKAR
jgi:glycosyltransferase involved in cell wall biosynthesis